MTKDIFEAEYLALMALGVDTFAEACYNYNTIDELKSAPSNGSDKEDMANWSLSEAEWVEQIELAITALKATAAAKAVQYSLTI